VAWQVEASEAETLRREVFERIHELDEAPDAEQIKDKRRRWVYRLTLSDGRPVVVKVFRVRSLRDRLKERLLGSKAEAEMTTSRRLRAMGLPASHAVAVGRPLDRRASVRGYLVIEAAPHVIGCNRYLRRMGDPASPADLERMLDFARRLARFVRRLHETGVRHGDLHAGNILVRQDAAGGEEPFLLIDVQNIRIGRPPGRRHRAESIAQLWNTFGSGEPLREPVRAAFLDAYLAAEPALAHAYLTRERIERRCRRREARRLASRTRRCLKNTTQFAVEKIGDWRVYHDRAYEARALVKLVEGKTAERPEPGQEPADDRDLAVRAFQPERGWRKLLAFCRRPAGLRAYVAARRHRLEHRSGPRPVAAVVGRRGQARGWSFAILGEDAETDGQDDEPSEE
jgi:tRNA A-37 threonylcarbamoyl transferase component Bud32